MAKASNQADDGESDTEISFRDAEDYVEHRRQKEILDAVKFVRETQNATKSEYERGQIDLETRRAEVRTVVESLIMEIEQIIFKSGDTALLNQMELGSITLEPPYRLINFVEDSKTRIWGDKSLQPKRVYTINGVEGYLSAPEQFTATWTVRADIEHSGPQPVSDSVAVRMPVEVSMNVFRELKRFLSDVDLDLDAQLDDYTADNGPGL